MVGGREFHRVGPAFLKSLEYMDFFLDFWEIMREHNIFGNEEKIILYVF